MTTVYLIHFETPISAHHTAQHYLGSTHDLQTRLDHHANGTSGARLPQVAHDLGIDFVLARTWKGDRKLERALKNRKQGPKLCPLCNPNALALAGAKEGQHD